MIQKFKLAAFFVVLSYSSAYCMQHSSSSALEVLKLMAEDAETSENAALTAATHQVPLPSLIPPPEEKGVTNNLSVFFLKELGNPPGKDEAAKIENALAILNQTKIGRESCKSFGPAGCTWDNLKSAKVEITTRDLQYHLPEPLESLISLGFASSDPIAATPKPSAIKGRTIVCLDKELISKHSPAYISTFLLHELSHVTDNRKFGEWDTSLTNLGTEHKAVTTQMMIHDEYLRNGTLSIDHMDGVQFLLSVYRWKNGGPKPYMDFSTTINGEKYSAAEMIGMLDQGDTGLQAIWKLTRLFYQISEGTMTEKDLRYLQKIRGVMRELEPKYQAWFPSKPPVVVPPPAPQPPLPPHQPPVPPQQPAVPPQQPQPPQPSPPPPAPQDLIDDGGPVSPWPFNPNPHFQDGIK